MVNKGLFKRPISKHNFALSSHISETRNIFLYSKPTGLMQNWT